MIFWKRPNQTDLEIRKRLGIPENPQTINDLPEEVTPEMADCITFREYGNWVRIMHRDLMNVYHFCNDAGEMAKEIIEEYRGQIKRKKKRNGRSTTGTKRAT